MLNDAEFERSAWDRKIKLRMEGRGVLTGANGRESCPTACTSTEWKAGGRSWRAEPDPEELMWIMPGSKAGFFSKEWREAIKYFRHRVYMNRLVKRITLTV